MVIANPGYNYTWQYTSDPDSAVQNSTGIFASIGDTYLNTTTGHLFTCSQSTPSQTWETLYPQTSSNRSQSSTSRSLNAPFQISASQDSLVNYSVNISASSTLLGGQTGTVLLQICSTSGFISGVQTVASFENGNTVSLAIAITLTQVVTGTLSGYVPSGYYCRLLTQNTSGSPIFTYASGQEILL